MRTRTRGGALLLVLLVMALVAVIGFALGDLCVINLNMSRQYLASSRARLLAQAAVEQFMVTYDQACAKVRANGLDLEKKGEAADLGLRALYESGEALPSRPYTGMEGSVSITFDASQPYHSTDNSVSEYAKAGWADRGTSSKSVPPFSVDLIINVDVDGAVRHYEAIVGRRWPFAVFAGQGVVVLCGTPIGTTESTAAVVTPSYVDGRVGTMAKQTTITALGLMPQAPLTCVDPAGGIRASTPPRTPTPGATPEALGERIDEVAELEEARYDAVLPPGALVAVGPPVRMVVKRDLPPGVALGPTPPSQVSAPPDPSPAPSDDAPLTVSVVTDPTIQETPEAGYGQPGANGQTPGQGNYGPPDTGAGQSGNGQPGNYPATDATPAPGSTPPRDVTTVEDVIDQSGNVLTGDVYVSEMFNPRSPGLYRPSVIAASNENTFSGKVLYGAWPGGVDEKRNPVSDAKFPDDLDGYDRLPKPTLPDDLPDNVKAELTGAGYYSATGEIRSGGSGDNNPTSFGFLFDTLRLDPDLPDDEGKLQFGGSSRYVYAGDLGNRFVKKETTTRTVGRKKQTLVSYKLYETRGGLNLRNCTLYVKGNLDLSAKKTPGDQVGIEGSNATLIVDGTLALSGGHLDSRDQGMVIFARDVVLRAKGDYRGLIIATNSLSILPASNDGKKESMLNIRGGLFNGGEGGETVLRSVHVVYDPVYMKAVHNYGQAVCSLFRDIP